MTMFNFIDEETMTYGAYMSYLTTLTKINMFTIPTLLTTLNFGIG
jgi:hypothetical protein